MTLECELSRHNVDVKWTNVKLHDILRKLILIIKKSPNPITANNYVKKNHQNEGGMSSSFRMKFSLNQEKIIAFTQWEESVFYRY